MQRTEDDAVPGARSEPVHPDVRFERQDVRIAAIVKFGIALFVVAVVIHVGVFGLLKLFGARARREQPIMAPDVAASLKRTPAEPRLEAVPLVPRQRLRAEEDAALSTYGWVDRAGGVARVPIERAIDIVTERGVPGGKPMTPGAAAAGSAVPASGIPATPRAAGGTPSR